MLNDNDVQNEVEQKRIELFNAVRANKVFLVTAIVKYLEADNTKFILESVDEYGQTALHIAAILQQGKEKENKEITEILVNAMTDEQLALQAEDRESYTALHLAVQAQNAHLVKILVERSKQYPKLLEIKDKYGQTVLHWATVQQKGKEKENREIVESLVNAMTDEQLALQAEDRESYTALHIAIQAQNLFLVEKLIERSKKYPKLLEIKDKYGQTVLQWTSVSPGSKIEKAIVEAFALSKKNFKELTEEQNYQEGLRYYYAIGVGEDFIEAAKYFKLAADKGHAEAKFYLADIYENERDGNSYTNQDVLKLYRESAENNYCRAQWTLGYSYEHGELGLQKDLELAAQYYHDAWSKNKYEGYKGYFNKFFKEHPELSKYIQEESWKKPGPDLKQLSDEMRMKREVSLAQAAQKNAAALNSQYAVADAPNTVALKPKKG